MICCNARSALVSTIVLAVTLACAAADDAAPRELTADSLVLFEMDSATVSIRDVAVAPDGDVWAIGTSSPFGHRYSADGRLVQRFGRQGRGPGELRTPWAVLPTGDPQRPVEIFDMSARALVVYDSAMRETVRRPIAAGGIVVPQFQSNTFGQMRWLGRNGDGYVFFDQPGGVIATRGIQRSVLVRLDSAGAAVDTLLDLRGDAPPVDVSTRPLEFVSIPLVATCPEGGVLLLEAAAPVIRRLDSTGALLAEDTVSLPGRPLTEDDLRPWLVRMFDESARSGVGVPGGMDRDQMITQFLREQRSWFGEQTPAATGLLCDSRGRAWVQEFSTADDPNGRGRRWRIFDGDHRVATVALPPRFRPYVITPEGMVGVHTDALDQQRVARVILPPI